MNVHQLAPDEPLSPELVLVLPPELRAEALSRLPAPVWLTPRPRLRTVKPAATVADESLLRTVEPAATVAEESLLRSLGAILVPRVVQLAVIFAVVTILILGMSLVANAMR